MIEMLVEVISAIWGAVRKVCKDIIQSVGNIVR